MTTKQPVTQAHTFAGTPTRRLRLVVVDDDADVRKALSRLLSSLGCTVTSFASAEAYLARAHDDDPDCLLLDIGLGGMNGFELREELLRSGAGVPIVFTTGQDDEATQQALLQLSSVPCLRKPFTNQSLLSAIAHVTQAG
jgi:FixJ family two-component response regulator